MSPDILNTVGSCDKEISNSKDTKYNTKRNQEVKNKRRTLHSEWILHGSGMSGPQLQTQAYCLL